MKILRIFAVTIATLCATVAWAYSPVNAMKEGTKDYDARMARELVKNGVDSVDDWAQVKLAAASIRTAGRHSAEMSTQAIMGTPLKVLERGDWWHVQTPDGYTGWIPSSSVVAKTADEMSAWRNANRYVVWTPFQINVSSKPEPIADYNDVVSDLVNGSIVVGDGKAVNGFQPVILPDGRKGYVPAESVVTLSTWADQPFDPERILQMASSMMGVTYLWGGTTTKALDCSGLAKVCYLANGRILMRDASQQAVTGTRIEADDWRSCRRGDLLFFGNADTGKVTHVAIYDHDGEYVHSSGRVKRNSVDPESPLYLTTPFLHAVRIAGNDNTPGITPVISHPWYFDGMRAGSVNPQNHQFNKGPLVHRVKK